MTRARHELLKTSTQLVCLLVATLTGAQGSLVPAAIADDQTLAQTLNALWPALFLATGLILVARRWRPHPSGSQIPGKPFALGYIVAATGHLAATFGWFPVPTAAIILCAGLSAVSLAGLLVDRIHALLNLGGRLPEPHVVLGAMLVTGLVVVLSFTPAEISIAAVAAMVIASCLDLLLGERSNGAREEEAGAADRGKKRDRLSKKCLLLGQRYQLSERETQVAEMMARGKTVQRTADELGISQNTVRAHSKHIYAKLGIHKKQDLLDIIDLFDADVAPRSRHRETARKATF